MAITCDKSENDRWFYILQKNLKILEEKQLLLLQNYSKEDEANFLNCVSKTSILNKIIL